MWPRNEIKMDEGSMTPEEPVEQNDNGMDVDVINIWSRFFTPKKIIQMFWTISKYIH